MITNEIRANENRRNDITEIKNITQSILGESVERITRAYEFMAETITECMQDCDELGRVAIQESGKDKYLLRCPLCSIDCGYGTLYKAKAKDAALNYISERLPKRIAEVLKTAKHMSIYNSFQQFDWKGILFIYGDRGTGKSVAAAWIMLNLLFKRFTQKLDISSTWGPINYIWANTFELLNKDEFNKMKFAPILIIDDFPNNLNQREQGIATEIICQRFDNNKPTIMTSNFNVNGSTNSYGEILNGISLEQRAKDRLLSNDSIRVHFQGDTMR